MRPPVNPSARPGAEAAGGYYTAWDPDTPDAAIAEHIEFQFSGILHQTNTALSGMWLFLASELLFFGPLFLLYVEYRGAHPEGFAAASRDAELWIGTINTVLLLTGSALFSAGVDRVRRGDNRFLFRAAIATAVLGVAFLLLKGYEWSLDLGKHEFPGPGFSMSGPDAGGAEIFWSFYFVATGLHGLHMIVGVALILWSARAARQGRFSPGYYAPVEAIGLYWSFVDMVWLVLYPAIYLSGRVP